MNELSLYSGAGLGLLGTKLLGWRLVGCVEIDRYCRRVLRRRMRDGHLDRAPIFSDVRVFIDRYAAAYTGLVDVVTAGFPCQPFSQAGRRGGAGDDRNLWPETLRTIRIVRPRWVLLENVPNLLAAPVWKRPKRVAVRGYDARKLKTPSYAATVLGELSESGYDCRWDCIPASAVGAPHQRDRLWIVALSRAVSDPFACRVREQWQRSGEQRELEGSPQSPVDGEEESLADAASDRRQQGRAESAGEQG